MDTKVVSTSKTVFYDAAMNMGIYIPFGDLAFSSFWIYARSETAEPYDNYTF